MEAHDKQTYNNQHNKGLSVWHLTMLALGTVVGGSFFLGSSVAIRAAGPSVLLAYILGGILVYFILSALSEMTVGRPAAGSFRSYAEQAFGKGAGFIVGWVYWSGLVLAMSSEATAASILLQGWYPGISLPLVGALIIIAVTLLNLLGAKRLSQLESGLAAVKLAAIVGFVVVAGILVAVTFSGEQRPLGVDELIHGAWLPGGIRGVAGSMLMVMFTYAGFEVLGLAASETTRPDIIVPKAIRYTLITLVTLYLLAMVSLFMLMPPQRISEHISPFVSALQVYGLGWAGTVMNIVLVSAILSTMLASVFGLGRMLRSLAEEGHTPRWMKDSSDIPYRGILISGSGMLAALGFGLLLPQSVYLFLVSSGGFALLFSYVMMLLSHYKLRLRNRGPLAASQPMRGFPYTSWLAMAGLLVIIVSMPLIPGQGGGLIAGLSFMVLFTAIYLSRALLQRRRLAAGSSVEAIAQQSKLQGPAPAPAYIPVSVELAEELAPVRQAGSERNGRKRSSKEPYDTNMHHLIEEESEPSRSVKAQQEHEWPDKP
ncbi:amino acid permease [Paenibacillus sp. FSL K6-1230]|uniref:amino acid permease n=1 Tax=Paenibacillus sp. FSL K6-1230 TaxID=2921603 RepID=UPI0030FAD8F5